MSVIFITKAAVPEYLAGSDFYHSLSSDDDEEFSISNIHLKMTPEVYTPNDLSHLLHTLQFWGLPKWPNDLFEFFETKVKPELLSRVKEILSQFEENFHLSELFDDLQEATSAELRVNAALKCGRQDTLEYVLCFGHISSALLVKCAAENGLTELLMSKCEELTARAAKIPLSNVSLSKVASGGHADCLHFLLTKGCKMLSNVCLAAAENGHLECLKVSHTFGCSWDRKLTNAVALHGHTKCLEYALQEGCPIGANAALNAAKNGHIECLTLLLDRGAFMTKNQCAVAARNGNFACLLFLIERGCPMDASCAKEAASQGHLDCLQLLCDRNCPLHNSIADAAATGGHLHCLQLLVERGCPVKCTAVDEAASNNHLGCLTFLLERGHKATDRGLHSAAWDGSVDCARAIHDSGVILDTDTLLIAVSYSMTATYLRTLVGAGYSLPAKPQLLSRAVEQGNTEAVEYLCTHTGAELREEHALMAADTADLDMLKVLCKLGCPLSAGVCAAAVTECYTIAVLKYLHEHHCPWDATTTAAAARYGRLDCLQYAVEHGCALSDNACNVAAEGGHIGVLEYLHSVGAALTLDTSAAAVRRGRMKCLKFCFENHAPFDASLCVLAAERNRYTSGAAAADEVTMLRYLHRVARCPWDTRTCAAAAAANRVDLLSYAHNHGCPWDASTCTAAAKSGAVECLQYAHEHGCPWDKNTSRAARTSRTCLQYCVEHGCPIDKATMKIYNEQYD